MAKNNDDKEDKPSVINLLKSIGKEFGEDKVPRLAAALAYYTVFSLAPLLLLLLAITGLILHNNEDVRKQLVTTIGGLVGPKGAPVIDAILENANKPGTSLIASIIGGITLLLGASGVFGQLKDALNTIWEVKPKEGLGIMGLLRERFLSFGMVLGTGFLLLVSLVVSAALSAVGKFLGDNLPGGAFLWNIINYVVTLLFIAAMFMLMFKFLPDAKIGWKDVWIGGLITATLFIVGQIGLGIYLGSGSVGSAYGGAGSLVILLVWIYYSGLIFFVGAEFTQAYARMYGSLVRPADYAEGVTEEARGEQGIPHKEGDSSVTPDKGSGSDRGGSSGTRGKKRQSLRTSPWFR